MHNCTRFAGVYKKHVFSGLLHVDRLPLLCQVPHRTLVRSLARVCFIFRCLFIACLYFSLSSTIVSVDGKYEF